MAIYGISVKITGSAYGEVEAETYEMAQDMFDSGQVEFKLDDWDINTDSSRGGYVDIEECK